LLGAEALYPFGQAPYRPFLRWALKGGSVSSSTLGMLIHPEYGLWHAYRFALALPEPLDEIVRQPEAESPCLSCETKACLFSCPVNAFTRVAYKVDECVDYLRSDSETQCSRAGCLARSACPVGANHRYNPEQMQFHMRAFLAARLAKRNNKP
jgi:ferredoxin